MHKAVNMPDSVSSIPVFIKFIETNPSKMLYSKKNKKNYTEYFKISQTQKADEEMLLFYDEKFLKCLNFDVIVIEKYDKDVVKFLEKGILFTLFVVHKERVSINNMITSDFSVNV